MPDRLNGRLTPEGTLDGSLSNRGTLRGVLGGTGAVVTYASLPDKPSINGVTLVGNKTTSDLHISFNDLEDKPTFPDVDEIEDRLDTLEGETASLDLRLTSAEGNITSINSRLTSAEGNISSLDGRVTTSEGAISDLQDGMSDVQGDISDVQGDISDLETGLAAAEGNISSLSGRMTTAEGDISSLAGRMTTAEGNITSLDGRVTTAEGGISDLETGLSTAEGNITSLDGRVTTNEGDISDLQGDMSQAQSDITQLNSSKANKQWTRVLQVDITSNTDQTLQVEYPDGYSELLFSVQRLDTGRTIGTNTIPKEQFNGGACYVSGSYSIVSLPMNQNAFEYVNGVFIYASANSIEVAFNKGSVNLRARVFAR